MAYVYLLSERALEHQNDTFKRSDFHIELALIVNTHVNTCDVKVVQ